MRLSLTSYLYLCLVICNMKNLDVMSSKDTLQHYCSMMIIILCQIQWNADAQMLLLDLESDTE